MKKTDDIRWVDFVRGVADPETEQELRARLSAGAGEEEARCWRHVAALGRSEAEGEITREGDLVRLVKAMGRLPRSPQAGPLPRPLAWLRARLVFSSGGQPSPAGARGHEAPARHLVFETEGFVVDVRFERYLEGGAAPGASSSGIVNGQIFRQADRPRPVPRTPVLVFDGVEIVRSTSCDDAGEFQAENLPTGDLRLCLLVGQGACIEIPLDPA